MKFLFAITILASSFAFAGELDGKTFCRKVNTGGAFGQPAGEREVCVSFKENEMTDNSPTFFGNPPDISSYVVVGGKVLTIIKEKLTAPYSVDKKMNHLNTGDGVKLDLKQ